MMLKGMMLFCNMKKENVNETLGSPMDVCGDRDLPAGRESLIQTFKPASLSR